MNQFVAFLRRLCRAFPGFVDGEEALARTCGCGCHECNCAAQAPCLVCGQPGCEEVCVAEQRGAR